MTIPDVMFPALAAGALHVAMGPDHISAIMTVSVCQRCKAFWYGIRWGVGHSVGLALVAVLLWTIEAEMTDTRTQTFAYVASYISGAFMLTFGLYFLAKAKSELDKIAEIAECRSARQMQPYEHVDFELLDDDLVRDLEGDDCDDIEDSEFQVVGLSSTDSSLRPIPEMEEEVAVRQSSQHSRASRRTKLVQALVSFCAGILGGIAGPGGMLAIVPASYYSTAVEAYTYIGSFFVASTLMMGIVAALYGEVTYRLASRSVDSSFKVVKIVYYTSCGASIAVGILWIVLNATGTLKKILG